MFLNKEQNATRKRKNTNELDLLKENHLEEESKHKLKKT